MSGSGCKNNCFSCEVLVLSQLGLNVEPKNLPAVFRDSILGFLYNSINMLDVTFNKERFL